MNKPIKPNITIPQSFAENGIKTDFYSDLLTDGFDNLRPDVLAGDNLNKFIDDTYKGLNYGIAAADAINLINEGETLTVKDGELVSDKVQGGGTGHAMFDTVLKDHVLTYEESKGLALQGTYVYKEAIAGSRYGYPDFYNKCLEEFENDSNTQQYLKSNITKVGSVVDTQGVLSGLSTGNYAKTDIAINFGTADTWEIVTKHNITSTGSVNDGFMGILGGAYNVNYYLSELNRIKIELSSNGTSYDIGRIGMLEEVPLNTDFYIKAEFTGNAYNLYYGKTLDSLALQGTISSSVRVGSRSNNFALGVDESGNHTKWVGTINLNESYINVNGSRLWTGTDAGVRNSNGHVFYDISIKDQIDEIFDSTGMAWMYGIDTENERIFLPRNNWFTQTTGDISEVGDSVEAGLPNITGVLYSVRGLDGTGASDGALWNTAGANNGAQSGVNTMCRDIRFDASRSNPIYGNSTTVQPNAVKKLLYICVGNTESQSTITDVVDVTTTENDTIPLGYSTYQANVQPSVSWLKSQGQWNDGNVYTTFYNEFAQKIGQDFASGYVKEYTDSYDDYDLVINQDDMTFRLPLLDGSEDLVSDKYTDLTLGASGDSYTAPANGWVTIKGTSTATNPSIFIKTDSRYISEYSTFNNVAIGTTLFVSKGCKFVITYNHITDINLKFTYAQGNGSLYFKVANAVQNLELLNAGEVLEAVNNVIPNNAGLIANYSMPDYEAMVTGTATNWVQVMKDSFVVLHTSDVYTENYYVYVAPDNTSSTSPYIVGHRYDDVNSNTQSASFTFFVPKGWYFRCNSEGTKYYYIYPLKGAN